MNLDYVHQREHVARWGRIRRRVCSLLLPYRPPRLDVLVHGVFIFLRNLNHHKFQLQIISFTNESTTTILLSQLNYNSYKMIVLQCTNIISHHRTPWFELTKVTLPASLDEIRSLKSLVEHQLSDALDKWGHINKTALLRYNQLIVLTIISPR